MTLRDEFDKKDRIGKKIEKQEDWLSHAVCKNCGNVFFDQSSGWFRCNQHRETSSNKEIPKGHPLVVYGLVGKEKIDRRNQHCSVFKDTEHPVHIPEEKKKKGKSRKIYSPLNFAVSNKNKSDNEDYDIWNYNEDGEKKSISHHKLAEVIFNEKEFKTTGDIKHTIHYYEGGVYQQGGEKLIAERCEELCEGRLTTNIFNETVNHIKRWSFTNKEVFEKIDPKLICVGNGILNMVTKELIHHTPEILFTQKLKWSYKPDQDCPKFKQFLKEVLNESDIPTIQEFIGFCLYRKYFLKKAAILVGGKNTGKTTFIKALVKFIDKNNTSGVSLHSIAIDKFSAAAMENKLLNFYDDLSFRDIDSTGEFKIAAGGGYINAEKKFGERYVFLNYAKHLFATNKISTVKDCDDDAYYERWLIIFFNNEFDVENPKTDYNLVDKITTKEEMEGLLNWAIEGLNRLLDNGRFSYDKTAEDNKQIMMANSDSLSAFAQDCLVKSDGCWISKEYLFACYSKYVEENELERTTIENVGRRLPKIIKYILGARRDIGNKKNVRGWLNVKISTTSTSNFPIIYDNIKHDNIPNNTKTKQDYKNSGRTGIFSKLDNSDKQEGGAKK